MFSGRRSKIEFNSDGTPKGYEQISPKPVDFSRSIIINYENKSLGDCVDCKFTIKLPDELTEEKIKQAEEWVNEKMKTDFSTSINLEKVGKNRFELLVSGIGHDGRCSWCKSFRTALKTFCERDNLFVKQMNFCTFEH